MATEERKAQLEFEIVDNTKTGADSIKSSVGSIGTSAVDSANQASKAIDGIAKAGEQAGQRMEGAARGISSSIKREISSAQREIAKLQTEASGGSQPDFFSNLISRRSPEAARALQPLIDQLRNARSELDLMSAAQKNATASNLFEQQHQAAKRLVQDSEYVRMWTDALDKKEAAERRAAGNNAFISSLKAQSDAIGKTKADLLEMQAAQMGVSDQAAPYISRLRQQEQAVVQSSKVLNQYGKTAKETAANLRQVPAQITDIVVSLQGGQAPLTVLLQQGGQLRDVFGGVTPAAKALGGAVLNLVSPLTLTAAAVVALGVAYNQGSKEADAYLKSLVLTGNAAGTTVSQMKAAAVAVSEVVGTQGAAAEVVAQLAATGEVGSASMAKFATTTLKAERDLGISTKEMVKNFEALGESPAEAALKLNKQYNFLNVAIYEQIRALEQQGKVQEAATLAQNTYADAMDRKSDQLRSQLGSIERAWQGITSAAKKGWDAILNVGRSDTIGDTLAQAQKDLEQKLNTPLAVDNPAMRASREKAIEQLRTRIGLLQSDVTQQRRAAEAEAERTRATEAGLRVSKLIEDGQSKREKMDKELNRLQEERNRGYITEDAYTKAVAVTREKYKEAEKRGDARGAQSRQAELADIRAKIKAEEDYTERLKTQGIQAEKNTAGLKLADTLERELAGTLDAKTRAHKELMLAEARRLDQVTQGRKEEEERAKAIEKSQDAMRKQVQAVYDEATATEQNRIKVDETTEAYGRSAIAVAQLAAERTKLRLAEAEGSDSFSPAYVDNLRRLLAEQTKSVASLQNAEFSKVTRSLEEQIALGTAVNQLQVEEIGLLGMNEVQRKQIIARREQEIKLAKELREIDQSGMTDPQKEEAKAKARERNRIESVNAANKVILDDWQKTADSINSSLTDALLRGFESGKGFAKNLRDTLVNMFKTMVLRPVISAVLSPISGAISGLLPGGAGGAAGGIGGIANLASTANSAYNLYQGGLSGLTAPGSMYYNFATSSIGQGLGLSNAASIAGNNPSAFMPAGTQLTNPFTGAFGGAGGAGTGTLAGAGVFAAVALAIGNILGAFRTETLNGSGLRGTLGNGKDLQPWEEWREGGTLLSGPEFSTMNPVEALTSARARLADLQASSAAGTLGNPQALATQQSIVDQLEKTYGSLAEATAKQSKLIQSAFDAMRDSAVGMATTLGLSTDKVKDFTTQLGGNEGLNFKDLKPEEIQAKITEALATANNELAQQLIGTWETTTSDISRVVSENIGGAGEDMMLVYSQLGETITSTRYVASEYAKDGEKAIDTLTRLANSLSTVNGIWDQLGNTLLDASLKGADAASRIVEAFGGLEAMSAITGDFFQNFYSDEERREAMRRQLQGELDKIGLTLPDIDASNAREQYRALAEAQDRNTDAGLKAYVVLMQLSGGFASITEEAGKATDSLDSRREASLRALERAVSAEKRILQDQIQVARDIASTLDNLFGILHTNVQSLYGEVDDTRDMQARQGNDFITKALETARKTGYLPDADQLAEAINAARGGLSDVSDFGGDRAERDYAALVLAGKLSGLEDITEKQLTDAQKTVRQLELQSDQLDQVLDYWRQQIEIANGTYEGILSVSQAVAQLSAQLMGTNGTGKPGGANTVGGGTSPASGGGVAARVGYGADEALESFDKFKAWYKDVRMNGDPSKLMDEGYQVPDWMRFHNGADDDTDKEQFGSYLFFKNNPQYAKDLEQIYATGRSSYATDGSTLVKSDLSKMPKEAQDFYRGNTAALLGAEGFGIDPVLSYQLYTHGPQMFGLDGKKQSFTEWLQTHKWTEQGLVDSNNVVAFGMADWKNYNSARWQTSSGNIIDTDGTIYSKEGKRLGMATDAEYAEVYGAGKKPPVRPSSGREDYLNAIRANTDDLINKGWTAQQLADALVSTNTSLSDIAAAYGISVDQVKENLIAGGATSIPKYQQGTNYVPQDGPAFLHKGEAVVPKPYNPAANGGRAANGNARLEYLVEQLVNRIGELEGYIAQTADNTGASATVLRNASNSNGLITTTPPSTD